MTGRGSGPPDGIGKGDPRKRTGHLEPGWIDALDSPGRGASPAGATLVRVLEHLAQTCAACGETLAPYPGAEVEARVAGKTVSPASERYREETERAVARVEDLLRERAEAPPRLDELEVVPLSRALGLLASSPRFRTWGVAALMLEEATAALRDDDGEGAERMTTLAALVVGRLDPGRYGAGLVEDTTAITCTLRSESMLLRGDLLAAKEELDRAEEHWKRGTAPWFHGARIELARCRLLVALGRPAAAARHLADLADRAQRHSEIDLFFDALALLVGVSADLGEPEGALRGAQVLEAGWSATDRGSPRERAAVAVDVARAHCTAGLDEEALLELEAVPAGALGEPIVTGRLSWWTGVALRGLGRRPEAVEALARARHDLQTAGRSLDAARAALDLLLLHAEDGEAELFAQETEHLSDLLTAEDLPRPAAATLLRFQALARRVGPDPELTFLARHDLDGPWAEEETPGTAH